MQSRTMMWNCVVHPNDLTVQLYHYNNVYSVFHGNTYSNNAANCAIWLYDIVMGILQEKSTSKEEEKDILLMIARTSQELAEGKLPSYST